MPETIPAPAEPVVESKEPASPQDTNRTALYDKYYGTAAPPEPEPVKPPEPAPEFDYKAGFEALKTELETIKQAVVKPPEPEPAPAPEPDWFALLQQGKRSEAEDALKQMVAKGASTEIIQQSVAQAVEAMRIQEKINEINNNLRVQNPDLLPFERWIALDAEIRFNAERSKIDSADTYVSVYNKAVSDAMAEVRKQFQLARAAGKDEARTIQREVLAASTIQPNAIVSPREVVQSSSQEQVPDISPSNYLANRLQAMRGAKGLSQ